MLSQLVSVISSGMQSLPPTELSLPLSVPGKLVLTEVVLEVLSELLVSASAVVLLVPPLSLVGEPLVLPTEPLSLLDGIEH